MELNYRSAVAFAHYVFEGNKERTVFTCTKNREGENKPVLNEQELNAFLKSSKDVLVVVKEEEDEYALLASNFIVPKNETEPPRRLFMEWVSSLSCNPGNDVTCSEPEPRVPRQTIPETQEYCCSEEECRHGRGDICCIDCTDSAECSDRCDTQERMVGCSSYIGGIDHDDQD